MNRATALIIAAIAVLTGGYLYYDSLQDPAPDAAPPASEGQAGGTSESGAAVPESAPDPAAD